MERWQLDYASIATVALTDDKLQPVGLPAGPIAKDADGAGESAAQRHALKHKLAWKVVEKQVYQLPMTLFMMYMMGSSITIWTFGFLGYLMYNPIRSLFSINNEFKRFEDSAEDNFLVHKLAYTAVTLVYVALGAWKCSGMGLIPSSQADWLEFMQIGAPQEIAAGMIATN
ncbi:uncharacterized protein MONBRDRAFT_18332 [Monosiga brevicollis MX1]|uniref:ER membrane protein complex subunit 4 n=1 Tax=Monosiga brevicollis TaxID=81824 RepID=A9UUF5_MONBE|nr:uncharacterized protein MONBRDRAFT_18332 [Monosiga brevicollis MX1]EDQ91090.1 predicted protein [Monosiga brevicollis MX1]|eukprot:XP_001744387.1 hypothetical protein [Monosiga brevicollis MX1]